MKNLLWCKSCVLPNTRPNLSFNKAGICNACEFKKKKIQWKKKYFQFKKIISHAKKNQLIMTV